MSQDIELMQDSKLADANAPGHTEAARWMLGNLAERLGISGTEAHASTSP
ncbi:hypothetical protein [Saccharopolyspora sp. NPDC003762]